MFAKSSAHSTYDGTNHLANYSSKLKDYSDLKSQTYMLTSSLLQVEEGSS